MLDLHKHELRRARSPVLENVGYIPIVAPALPDTDLAHIRLYDCGGSASPSGVVDPLVFVVLVISAVLAACAAPQRW